MYGDVNVAVEDGNLGRSNKTGGTGTHIKIGISGVKSSTPILITGSMNAKKIKEKLGTSPLADACIDSVEWGAKSIYCIPVEAGVPGTAGEVKKEAKGTGSFKVEGNAANTYDIVVVIVDSGDCGEGSYKVSIDGGNTFTDDVTIPLNGTVELQDTGLTMKFEDGEGGDAFVEGDSFSFSTTAPSMNHTSVINAVESLINNNLSFEYVHIVGESTKALWASLATLANDFAIKYKRPLFFICEARAPKSGETADVYAAEMIKERKGINNYFIQVVCSTSLYTRMDGRTQIINNAGIVAGLYGAAKESQSIGEVKTFPISEAKMFKLLPEGIEDHIASLDAAKYLTFRKYVSKEDYYVTSANMMSPDGSDYKYAEDVRVLNRLMKAVRAQALNELQSEIDPDNLEVDVANIEKQLEIPVEEAVRDKVLSSGSVTINTENLNILADESLDVRVEYVPMGHVREMNATFAVNNPYASSNS